MFEAVLQRILPAIRTRLLSRDLFAMRVRNPSFKIPIGLTNQLAAEESAFGRSNAKLHAGYLAAERVRLQAEIEAAGTAIVQLEANNQAEAAHQPRAISGCRQQYGTYPDYFAVVIAEIDAKRQLTPMRYRILLRRCRVYRAMQPVQFEARLAPERPELETTARPSAWPTLQMR